MKKLIDNERMAVAFPVGMGLALVLGENMYNSPIPN
jgi:hypothetical protein